MVKYDWGTIILLVLVVGHFIVGFGYLVIKLSPRRGDKKDEDEGDKSYHE